MIRGKELTVLWAVVAVTIGLSAYLSKTSAESGEPPVPAIEAAAPAPDPASPEAEHYLTVSQLLEYGRPRRLALHSSVALILDEREGVPLYEQNIDEPRPIASLTKLMTGMVLLDAKLPMAELIEINDADRDRLRGSRSRLRFGMLLSRGDTLQAALAASDNRAAAALARTYPGGTRAFIAAMNAKAQALGMTRTRFADASGLDSENVSTARDLAKLAAALRHYPLIARLSTTPQFGLTDQHSGRPIQFVNTNRLVRGDRWDIDLSKTGYTADAGNCLVMRTIIADRPLTIVLLNSWGKLSKYGDSTRIRDWLMQAERRARRAQPTLALAAPRSSL